MRRTYTYTHDGEVWSVPLTIEGGTVKQAGPLRGIKHDPGKGREEADEECEGCGGTLSTLRYLARGALKLGGAALKGKLRPVEEQERIWPICFSCKRFHIGWCARSRGGCGCSLHAKIMLADESCPDGEW